MSTQAWRDVHEDDPMEIVVRAPMSYDEARAATDRVRAMLDEFRAAVVDLYNGRAHEALRYGSWEEYVKDEFPLLPRMNRLERRKTVQQWAIETSMSQREIAATVGVDQATVSRALRLDADASASAVGEACGCCEIQDYAPPVDDTLTVACENCGHTPEEHEPDLHALHGNGDESEPPVPDGREGYAVGGGYKRVVDLDAQTVLDEVFTASRESEWPEVAAPGAGVVTSETPGGETAEAPASVDPDVEYKRWRSDAKRAVGKAEAALTTVAGDWLDADMVAQRADDALVDRLGQLAERLVAFLDNVKSLRAKAVVQNSADEVWVAVRRRGIERHEIADEEHTVCRRFMRTGERISRVEAEELGTKECRKCVAELARAGGAS